MTASTPQIGYLLKKAQAALHSGMEDALRPLGVSVSQYACLHLLHGQPGISAAELARSAFVTRQSMNSLLHTLVERGYVERPDRAATGRALPNSLTAHGSELLLRAERIVDEVEARMLARLDDTARHGLRVALIDCIDGLEAGTPSA